MIEEKCENLYTGWQSENEINMIAQWEDRHELQHYLSSNYENTIKKWAMHSYLESCAITVYGNPKEYKIKSNFLEQLHSLNERSKRKIESVIQAYQVEEDLPF